MLQFSILDDFLAYLKSSKGRSDLTIKEYYYDLTTFFRFLLIKKNIYDPQLEITTNIAVEKITTEILNSVTKQDIYSYISYLEFQLHNSNSTKYRKLSSLRTFYKYLSEITGLIDDNPTENIDMPKIKKQLPIYLSLDQALHLLNTVESSNQNPLYKWRDYAIITLFLNTGMRLSELSSINMDHLTDDDTIRVIGKGNKERTIYLNPSCLNSIEKYLNLRQNIVTQTNALFLSMRKNRMSNRSIQHMIEKHLKEAGFDTKKYTVHKLRHTAATLMYKYGDGDLRSLQEVLGHESVKTTEIYTHVDNEQVRKTVLSNPLSSIETNNEDI